MGRRLLLCLLVAVTAVFLGFSRRCANSQSLEWIGLQSKDEERAFVDLLGTDLDEGEEHSYYPDFIVRLDDGHGLEDPLNLIIEVTGEKKKDKAAKVNTANTLWVPAVNHHGGFGRWAFIEIRDPWKAKKQILQIIGIRT